MVKNVIVNTQLVEMSTLRKYETEYGLTFYPGSYWYDKKTGAWGRSGGPMESLIHPNLELGGDLRRDASKGNTGVIINNRELHMQDVAYLRMLLPMVVPGDYWMDHLGNFGPQGGFIIGNLWMIAASRQLPAPAKRVYSASEIFGVRVASA